MQNLPSLHLILRLPLCFADQVRQQMKSEDYSNLPVSYTPVPDDHSWKGEADYIFNFDGREYPSLLLNIPTPVEVHKTTDNKILTKAADIGQILQVSEDITSLRKIKEEVQKSKTPLGECLPHGLTPPTFDIVHRRFEQTRVKGTFLPNKIRTVMNDIVQYSSQLQNQQALQQQQPLNDSKVIERIIEVEEVVDFQDWMIDPLQSDSGRTIVIDDGRWDSECELLMYFPEILITAEDREEDEFEKLSQSQKTAEDDQVNSKHHALRAEGIRAGVEDETENIDDEDINMVGDDDIDEGAVDIQQEVQEQENDDQDDEGMAWLDSDDES